MVSIIIPTFNEKDNVKDLLVTIHQAFAGNSEAYEVIVIDDYSTDGTWELLNGEKPKYPLRIFKKDGPKGKAYSLFQGFNQSNGEYLVMIDADLQYPPEAIPEMISKLKTYDVVVANRKHYMSSLPRKVLSKCFNFLFSRMLHGIKSDAQSGLKAFRRTVLTTIQFTPKSPWTFDLEFLIRAKEAGFTICNQDINFYRRKNGKSKINTISASFEIGINALTIKIKKFEPQHIPAKQANSMLGAGIGYKRKKYITHTTLPHQQSAIKGLSIWQKTTILGILTVVSLGLFINTLTTAIIITAIISIIYFLDLLFNMFLIFKTLHSPAEITFDREKLGLIQNEHLPVYSILCPLYKEANVLPHFLSAIDKLDWPKDKLDVILLLEADDKESIEKVSQIQMPFYVRVLIVPDSQPKTKPKACNFGLAHARGEYLVIYDAEDIPDPLQLKKAYTAFQQVSENVFCLQAKLNYHNTNQNLLTRFFTAEYSLWFDVMLTGLQSIQTSIPLGGSSNHFRTGDLIKLEGWDPFNVTEDADLGIRLFKRGYKTAIIESTTLEEANSRILNWLRQRSRWIKGYMQTYFVHMRDPLKFIRSHGIHAFIFQLVVGGKISFMFINPVLWTATILYFSLRTTVGTAIEAIYPAPVFYMALTSLVLGNFIHMYYYMIGCAKRQKWNIIKYVYFVPFYWLLASVAAINSLYQLIFKPHYWEKTVHGLHLNQANKEQIRIKINASKFAWPRLPKISISSGLLLVFASVIANFLNFVNNAYLGRTISLEEFGLISLVNSFFYFLTVPLTALSRTITHHSAFLLGKYKTPIKEFWLKSRQKALATGIILSGIWIVLSPILSDYFNEKSITPFLLFAPTWLVGMLLAVDGGFLSGNLSFAILALITLVEPTIRLIISILLIQTHLTQYIYSAIAVSMSVSLFLAWYFAKKIKADELIFDVKNALKFPFKFFSSEILTRISIFAFLSFDLILAKHFLNATSAGQYAFLSLAGKMIFFVSSLFNQFIYPLVAKAEGEKKQSNIIFYQLLTASTLASFIAFIIIGVFGQFSVPFLFGNNSLAILPFLPMYSYAMFCFSIATTIVYFYQSKKKHIFSLVSGVLALAQVINIFQFHRNISDIVLTMVTIGIDSLIIVFALHFLYGPILSILRNLNDLWTFFEKPFKLAPKLAPASKNILIYNWRDNKHVWAGGAEVYISELAKRFVKDGHQVVIFCGNDGENPESETIDDITIIRKGGFYTVYIWAFIFYIFRFRGKFDIIIDSENGVPFFTPIYARIPVVCLIHHIHQDVFRKHLSFPLAQIAGLLESRLMPFVYRNIKMVTISESSKTDLENLGFGRKSAIDIIHPGVNLEDYTPSEKSSIPSIIYLGRLKPYKSVETAIYAIAHLIQKIPEVNLIIAGEGESRPSLEKLSRSLHLDKFIKFTGKVSDSDKAKLLAKSWVMIHPSSMEGWGISAIEANAAGTPVVAANVPGLRNSVKNPHSGFLVPWGKPSKFAEKIELIINNKSLRKELEEGARQWALNFSWEDSASKFLKVVMEEAK